MKALISPQEIQFDGNARVCEVAESSFPVALPLFWVKCAKSVGPSTHSYNIETKKFVELVVETIVAVNAPVATETQPITTGTVDL